MNKIKVTILGSIIATSLLLSGCNSEPEVYSVKISQVDKMKVSEIAQKMNADEMFAVYYIKMSSKEDINDKTVSEVVKMFEKETKTKVWNGIKEGVHFVGAVAGAIVAVAGAASALKGRKK